MSRHSNTYKTFNINEKTPDGFYKELDNEFHFNFDPCPLKPTFDGLNCDWKERCFINPPYGKLIPIWLEKAIYEIKKGNTEIAVFLLPAYTDVRWFHEIILNLASEIRFIKGRLKFSEHTNSAPFASMVIIFDTITLLEKKLEKQGV